MRSVDRRIPRQHRGRRGDRGPAAQHDRGRRSRGDPARNRGARCRASHPRRLQRPVPDRALARPRCGRRDHPHGEQRRRSGRRRPRIPVSAARRAIRRRRPLAVLHGRRHAPRARAGRVHRHGRDGRGPAQRRRDRLHAGCRLRVRRAGRPRARPGARLGRLEMERVPGQAPRRRRRGGPRRDQEARHRRGLPRGLGRRVGEADRAGIP